MRPRCGACRRHRRCSCPRAHLGPGGRRLRTPPRSSPRLRRRRSAHCPPTQRPLSAGPGKATAARASARRRRFARHPRGLAPRGHGLVRRSRTPRTPAKRSSRSARSCRTRIRIRSLSRPRRSWRCSGHCRPWTRPSCRRSSRGTRERWTRGGPAASLPARACGTKRARRLFLKSLLHTTLYSKYTRTLTCENVSKTNTLYVVDKSMADCVYILKSSLYSGFK